MSNLHSNPHLELPPPGQTRPQQQQQYIVQQQQEGIPSMYPKLPSQEDLPPGYSPYPQQQQQQQQQQPRPQQQYPQQYPQQQYPQQQYQQQQYQQQQAAYYQQAPSPQLQQAITHSSPHMQQPAFYGSMPAPNTTVIANTAEPHTIQPIENLKTTSQLVSCPHCQQLVYTVLDYDAGVCTAVSIGGLFLAGCHNGLCLLPWLFPWTKDVTHECPSCLQKIAKYSRLERDVRLLVPPPHLGQ